MEKNKMKGFTLVELLAVIVILAIILVIAVPKVMSVIEDAKKATLESTAKMIASAAEKVKVQNQVLGKVEEITCENVAKINDIDYESCSITFENNTAKVTIIGSGKFESLNVCKATKNSSIAINESCTVEYGIGSTYIKNLLRKENELNNGLMQTNVEYEGTMYDAGIRYVGSMDKVKNKVYYNCDDTDVVGVAYGEETYDYASSCEVWRIIGLFDTKSSENGSTEKRIKIINTASTFSASWDSSADGSIEGQTAVNNGFGINQWGESTYEDGTPYEGADLMRLLNGYYIGKEGSSCTYCSGRGQETCNKTCTFESLKSANMKVLTNTAKGMIENAVWDTYGVKWSSDSDVTSSFAPTAYLEEKGICAQYTGKICTSGSYCNDKVERTTNWTGLVGLMSVSDITYANGWLYDQSGTSIYPWTISAAARSDLASVVWSANDGRASGSDASVQRVFFPSVYLKSDIDIIGGDGFEEPYKLK